MTTYGAPQQGFDQPYSHQGLSAPFEGYERPRPTQKRPVALYLATAGLSVAVLVGGAFGVITHGQLGHARHDNAALTTAKNDLARKLKSETVAAATARKDAGAAKAEASQTTSALNGMTECAADLYTAMQSLIQQAPQDQIVSQINTAMPLCEKTLSAAAGSDGASTTASGPTA